MKHEEEGPNIPPHLGIFPLRNIVVYPHMAAPLLVARSPSLKLIDDVSTGDNLIALVAQRNQDSEYPTPGNLHSVGTVAKVGKTLQLPNNVMQIWVHGIARIRLVDFIESDTPYLEANVEVLPDRGESDTELEALSRNVEDLLGKITNLSEDVPDDLTMMVRDMDPSSTADMIAMYLNISLEKKQKLLSITDVKERLSDLRSALAREVSVLELSNKIQTDAKK